MPAVVITPQGAGATVTYAGSPNFRADGKWCESAPEHPDQHGMEFITAAGEDGAGSKDYGFRESEVPLIVIYVAASEAAVRAAFAGDMAAKSRVPSTISIDGGDIERCFLNAKASKMEQPKSTGYGKFWARAVLSFTCRG